MPDNKLVIRTFFEDIARGHTLFAPDTDRAAFQGPLGALLEAFPDIRYTIDDLVAEGDRVAVQFHWTGTHRGPFRSIPPTHVEIRNTGMAIFTLRDGLITNVALETDRLGFIEQVAPSRVTRP
jgi:predicted ester cyclase